jgi:hypothetical protein
MKYSTLEKLFSDIENEKETIVYSFEQIEHILGFGLPNAAKKHRQWWENNSQYGHSWAKSWLENGWKVNEVKQNYVIFKRNNSKSSE